MIRVYDADGIERDFSWARVKYNLPLPIEAPRDEDHWEVVALHEQIGNSSMTVRVIDEPSPVPIVFGWPDGEDAQFTNAEGHTGFGMGLGAYYQPETEQGPHYAEVFTTALSDEVHGLGMIPGRNHAHLEPTFQFVKGEEEPEDNTREALIAFLNALESAVERARRALGGE